MESEEKVRFLQDIVENVKAVDPVVLDIRGKTVMADFFLICSGNSNVHIRAIADRVLEACAENNLAKPRIEGWTNAEWVLLDFGDVILHIMAEEPRARYKLEEFWDKPHDAAENPPTPATTANGSATLSEDDLDAIDEDDDESAFFDDADSEVEPIDEDDLDDLDDEDVESLDELEELADEAADDDDPEGLHRRVR